MSSVRSGWSESVKWLMSERLVLWKCRRRESMRLRLLFRHDVIIGFNFQEPLENQREGLGGRLFERQDFDEMIIEPQVPAMAFEVGLAQMPVKKRIVLEMSGLELARIEVQDALE